MSRPPRYPMAAWGTACRIAINVKGRRVAGDDDRGDSTMLARSVAEPPPRLLSPRESPKSSASLRSQASLNAANFFLAEVLGVIVPFLAIFLAKHGWRDDAIGLTIALAGLGVCVMQTPAGFIVDRVRQRRALLAGASLVVGLGFGLLPLFPSHGWVVGALVFVAGMGQAFFVPLLGALALGLVGYAALNKTLGVNQGWNHAGNIAAALIAMAIVGW